MMSRGRMFLLDQPDQRLAGQERLALLGGGDGGVAGVVGQRHAHRLDGAGLMVLAVYMPPHEPAPGHASHSTLWTPFGVELAGLVLADRLEDARRCRCRSPSAPMPGRMLPP